MGGTNPVATFNPSNYGVQTGTVYPLAIDGNTGVAQRIIDNFAPRQSTVAAMTVALDPGHLFNGTTLIEVGTQTTGTITAPSGNPRIDRVVIDRVTGIFLVVTGTPASSPTPPAIPAGKAPVAQVLIQTSSTTITNSMITDERDFNLLGSGASTIPFAVAGGSTVAMTAAYTPANTSLLDGLLLIVRATAVNNTVNPTFAPDSLTAHTITRQGGQALIIGDIQNLQILILQYNLANTRWELLNPGQANIPWAVCGGTANALTLTNTPPIATLYDGLLVSGRATGNITSTTPTLQVDSTTAHNITKFGGQPLATTDISNQQECLWRYNLANLRFELLNAPPPLATISGPGLVKTLPNDATKYYDGTGSFSAPPASIPTYVAVGSSTFLADNGTDDGGFGGGSPTYAVNSSYTIAGRAGTWLCMGVGQTGSSTSGGKSVPVNWYGYLFVRTV